MKGRKDFKFGDLIYLCFKSTLQSDQWEQIKTVIFVLGFIFALQLFTGGRETQRRV